MSDNLKIPSVRNGGGGRRANILRERRKSKVSLHQRKIFEIYGPLGLPCGGTTLSAYVRRGVRLPYGPQMLGYASWFKQGVFQASDSGSNPEPSTNIPRAWCNWLACHTVTVEVGVRVSRSRQNGLVS